ncbi:hypothetical protein V492_05648, partial [Pseudogymnoascus sp. VKM F-4246]
MAAFTPAIASSQARHIALLLSASFTPAAASPSPPNTTMADALQPPEPPSDKESKYGGFTRFEIELE